MLVSLTTDYCKLNIVLMFGKRSVFTIILIAAVVSWPGSNNVLQAETLDSGPGYKAPVIPFDPSGNSFGSGKIKFYPELELGLIYEDNIFWAESDEESDVITYVIPRLMIDYSLQERGNLTIGYTGDFAFYSEFSDNNWQRNTLGLILDYLAPAGLLLSVADSFVDTSDPFGSRDEYGQGRQKERWFNLLGVSLGYAFADKLKILGYFNYNKQEYADSIFDYSQNFDEKQYGVGVEKRLTGKTWGFVRYFYVFRDFNTVSPDFTANESNDADYSSDRLSMGLTWDVTSRITGELSFGYESRKYENSADPGDSPYEDEDTWLAATNINYTLKPGVTDLNIRLERGIYPRGSDTSETFVSTDFGVAVLHRFYSWYRLNLYLGLENNDYNISRSDDSYLGGIKLEYLAHRRYTLAFSYDYLKRNSNEPGESFTDNRFLLSLTGRY